MTVHHFRKIAMVNSPYFIFSTRASVTRLHLWILSPCITAGVHTAITPPPLFHEVLWPMVIWLWAALEKKWNKEDFKRNMVTHGSQIYWIELQLCCLLNSQVGIIQVSMFLSTYEEYLNIRGINSLIRFRLSAHWLPIERGRHKRPIINREDRLCPLCKTCVGDEIHALMECKSDELKNIRSAYLPKIKTLLPDLESMTETHEMRKYVNCPSSCKMGWSLQ